MSGRDQSESFLLPWQPHAKKRPRISRGGGRTHQDPADKLAEDHTREYLREEMASRGLEPYTGNVSIHVVFYRETRQVVDLDNLLKHLLDAGNGVVWVDDKQITKYQNIALELDRDWPRTLLEVWPSPSSMTRGTDAP